MYVVAEHREKDLLYFYLASSKEEAERLVNIINLTPIVDLVLYNVDVINDVETMIQVNSLADFLEIIIGYINFEMRGDFAVTIVVCKRGYVGSYHYIAKSINEFQRLIGVLHLINVDGLQIVVVSRIEAYGEYHPSQEIKTIPELLGVISRLAQ